MLATITSTPIPDLLGALRRGAVPILALHRFADPAYGVGGQDPAQLRHHLAWLRAHKYRFLALDEMLDLLRNQPTQVRRAVVFTVDDGYDDFRRIGWPVFAEFDCPVTVFLTSDFIDGRTWYWWDKVKYLLQRSRERDVTLRIRNGSRRGTSAQAIQVRWSDTASRTVETQRLVQRLKILPDDHRLDALDSLAETVGCELQKAAPEQFAPLAWSDVRALASEGVTFGPHSKTHPILSRTTAPKAEAEIAGSWTRVKEELPSALPVFCYPNGMPEDFSSREIATVKHIGMEAALAAHPGYVTGRQLVTDEDARYRLPRFTYPESLADMIAVVSGVHRAALKNRMADLMADDRL
jgi:peptidoglycan/xylan/chitin deacetylase (PgdA/CDA1 family)